MGPEGVVLRSALRVAFCCVWACVLATAAALSLAPGSAVHAQTRDDTSVGSIDVGDRGGITGAAPARPTQQNGRETPVEFSARLGFATDYVYRGITLSARKPAVGAAFETAFGLLYAGATVSSVNLPSHPDAEITMIAGVRPKIGNIDFDFSWSYFLYPGETPPVGTTGGIEYWELAGRADTKIGEALRLAGGFAYSPNVSNTGAWSNYAAVGLGFDVPRNLLPEKISASLSGGAGYSWFGNQSDALGFPLPAYLNWNAGVTLTRERINLDLRYYDTNLSKENCFVLTGDPNATPGGSIDLVKNPEGLKSRWCDATFVAKLWFAFN